MIRHTLYEIDLKHRTAFCTACGHTEIYIANPRTRSVPKVYCIKRANALRESTQASYNLTREKWRSKPGWKPRHALSEINLQTLTAVCAVCGPTDIRQSRRKDHIRYDCAIKEREYTRKYRRINYVGRSTNPHALSQVNEEQKTAVCAKCGPVKIEIWHTQKKVNRRCINAKSEFVLARRTRNVE
jgi:DNA-directed RNA polymerase subunit M/transcription elongation factor TFIIS